METRLTRKFMISAIVAIMALVCMVTFVFSGAGQNAVAYAATDDSTSDLSNAANTVQTNYNVNSFGDIQVQPRWFTFQPRLGWTKNKNFSGVSYTDQEVTYYLGSGVHAFGGYINEECYSVTGTDSTGASYRLEPVSGLDQPNNINANGATTVQFSYIQDPRGTCVFYNDNSKLNSLTSGFYVNSTTTVGTGKILYRQTNGTTWGAWSFTNLNGSTSLSFSQTNVQIAVIYELNEKGRFMLDRDIHYYIAGIYRFNIA